MVVQWWLTAEPAVDEGGGGVRVYRDRAIYSHTAGPAQPKTDQQTHTRLNVMSRVTGTPSTSNDWGGSSSPISTEQQSHQH